VIKRQIAMSRRWQLRQRCRRRQPRGRAKRPSLW